MATTRIPKRRARHSIGEWYGTAFEQLPIARRRELAAVEAEAEGLTGARCPFQADAACNKKGGVCSLRLYEQEGAGPVRGVGPLITTCPSRFLERGEIFRWIGETVLGAADPIVLREIGFLDRLRAEPAAAGDEPEAADLIGRIDHVLVHPTHTSLTWCALELQAVYFSGIKLNAEFRMLRDHSGETLPFPAAQRRPDWRSSGPKRLLPQLQTKVPTIRTWGRKMAVVVDEAFFASLVGLETERHLSNAEIAWFVVGYELTPSGWRLRRRAAVFTKLDASVKALTGGRPLSQEQFESQLRQKLAAVHPGHPLTTR